MSTVIPYSIKMINGRNVPPDTIEFEDTCNYYKNEGGKLKCIKGKILKDEKIKVIQECKGVETDITNDNEQYELTQYIGYFEIRFNMVSRNMNNSRWCIEIHSLTNNTSVKRSPWINVESKRKIPAKLRYMGKQIINDYKKRKREEKNNLCDNKRFKSLIQQISTLKIQNAELISINTDLNQKLTNICKKTIVQNLALTMFKIQSSNNNIPTLYDELKYSNIPLVPNVNNINPLGWCGDGVEMGWQN